MERLERKTNIHLILSAGRTCYPVFILVLKPWGELKNELDEIIKLET